jgi:hypothetical protein
MEAHLGERRYSSYSFLTSALEGGEWSASRPGHALPPVPTICEAGWAPEPVWTQRPDETSSACRESNPGRPVRSQTLYWLSYLAPNWHEGYNKIIKCKVQQANRSQECKYSELSVMLPQGRLATAETTFTIRDVCYICCELITRLGSPSTWSRNLTVRRPRPGNGLLCHWIIGLWMSVTCSLHGNIRSAEVWNCGTKSHDVHEVSAWRDL